MDDQECGDSVEHVDGAERETLRFIDFSLVLK